MKPLTYYIDRFIAAVYAASLIGGLLVCMTGTPKAFNGHTGIVVYRSIASASGELDHMTADDFLTDNEKAADKKDITEYLDDLKKKGIREERKTDGTFGGRADDGTEGTKEEQNDEDRPDDTAPLKIDRDDWRLILVNKQNPVPDDFEPELSNINGSQLADSRIIEDIYRMMDAAADDGVDLMICSAYRSYDRQKMLFNNKLNKLMSSGMTYLEAYKYGSMNVTVPGTSEHHLGLALDILSGSYTTMNDGFGDTKAGKWLAENAPEYGFILRYPKGKEEITGIVYEPWHFRYVGTSYAKDITQRGVCLEEYLKGDM